MGARGGAAGSGSCICASASSNSSSLSEKEPKMDSRGSSKGFGGLNGAVWRCGVACAAMAWSSREPSELSEASLTASFSSSCWMTGLKTARWRRRPDPCHAPGAGGAGPRMMLSVPSVPAIFASSRHARTDRQGAVLFLISRRFCSRRGQTHIVSVIQHGPQHKFHIHHRDGVLPLSTDVWHTRSLSSRPGLSHPRGALARFVAVISELLHAAPRRLARPTQPHGPVD